MLFKITRYVSISAVAISITLSCFLLMQHMLDQSDTTIVERPELIPIVFEDVVIPKHPERPPRPVKPEHKPPPKLAAPNTKIPATVAQPIRDLAAAKSINGINGIGDVFAGTTWLPESGNGQLVKTVEILPQYPPKASIAGIEGWVKVEFTVSVSGMVVDVNVLDSQPRGIFEKAAVDAVSKWRFKPRQLEGQPVNSKAIQTLEFNLNND